MSRIFVGAQIVPRPAVEGAVTHTRNEVGHEIVAEIVALIGRAPEVARQRVHGKANAVSQPACGHSPITALRVEHEDSRAIGDRKSTRLNSSHLGISYAVFCLK